MLSRARVQLEVAVLLDGVEVFRSGVVDAVDVAGLQLEQALGRLFAPAEDQRLVLAFSPQYRLASKVISRPSHSSSL